MRVLPSQSQSQMGSLLQLGQQTTTAFTHHHCFSSRGMVPDLQTVALAELAFQTLSPAKRHRG
jgi:hypothetical protein